jgi:hypothetical protein
MDFATNLLNNLLVIGILSSLFIIIYCRVTGKTIGDIIREIKEGIINE